MKRPCIVLAAGLALLLLSSESRHGFAATLGIEGVKAETYQSIGMVSRNDRAPLGLVESMAIPGQHFVRVGFTVVPLWSKSVRHLQLGADEIQLIDGQGRGYKVAGYLQQGAARFGDTYISLQRPQDWQSGGKANAGHFEMIFAVPDGAVLKTLKLGDSQAKVTPEKGGAALITEPSPHIVVKGSRLVESVAREWEPARPGLSNTVIAPHRGKVLRVDFEITPTGPNNATLSGGRQGPAFVWSPRNFGLFHELGAQRIFCGGGLGERAGAARRILPRPDGTYPTFSSFAYFVVPDGVKTATITYALEPIGSVAIGAQASDALSLGKISIPRFPREPRVEFEITSTAVRVFDSVTSILAPLRSPLGLVESIDTPGMRAVLVELSLLPTWTAAGRRLEIPARDIVLVGRDGKRSEPFGEIVQSEIRLRFTDLSFSRPHDWKTAGAEPHERRLLFLLPKAEKKATLHIGSRKRELELADGGGHLKAEPVPRVVVKGRQLLDSLPLAERLCPPATAATKLRTPFGKLLALDVEITPTGSNDTEPMRRFHWAGSWVGLEYEIGGIQHYTRCVGEGHMWSKMVQLSDRFNSVERTPDGKLPVIATKLSFVVPEGAGKLRLTWLMAPVCEL
jgi:hypothetical protein